MIKYSWGRHKHFLLAFMVNKIITDENHKNEKNYFFAMLVIMSLVALGQDSDTMPIKNDMASNKGMMKNYITMSGSKLMMIKDGMSTPLTMDKTLKDGCVVKPDGTILMKNCMKTLFMDGDKISINDKISKKMGIIPR